jgi:hypothetical protein
MNKPDIINRYHRQPKHTARWKLRDGAVVIGEEIDELNRLQYVIKRGNEITVELAEGIIPVENLIKGNVLKIRVPGKSIKKPHIDETP